MPKAATKVQKLSGSKNAKTQESPAPSFKNKAIAKSTSK